MSTDDQLSGFDISKRLNMPSMAEIEEILALGDRSWTSLLAQEETTAEPVATDDSSSAAA